MRNALKAWPEIVFVDTTYNLLKRKLISLILCIQDSMGFTHIVGIALLANEQASTLKSFFNIFIKRNPEASKKIKCFMTDKDLTEKDVLKELFPDVAMYLCEFHVLKIFSRTITMANMEITAKVRDEALDLLDKLAKSSSEEQYNYLYEKLCNTMPESIIDYYNTNWHANKEEWVRYALSEFNFGNYTNNPVESTNASFKREIFRNSTLKDFL